MDNAVIIDIVNTFIANDLDKLYSISIHIELIYCGIEIILNTTPVAINTFTSSFIINAIKQTPVIIFIIYIIDYLLILVHANVNKINPSSINKLLYPLTLCMKLALHSEHRMLYLIK